MSAVLQFELTPQCNMNCAMCYIHEKTEACRSVLPASFWIGQAEQALGQGILVISLTGGETLLYPEIDELMASLSRMGFLLSFNTNGVLVDEERVEWFLQYCPNKINISLYGASDETYENMCGIEGGFTRVSRAIDLLMKAGLNVYLNGLLTPFNVKELSAMHSFAAQRGLVLHTSAYAFPHRTESGQSAGSERRPASETKCRTITGETYRLAPEEAAAATAANQIILFGKKKASAMAAAAVREIDVREADVREAREHGDRRSVWSGACNGGKSHFHISYEGQLHPCAMYQRSGVSLLIHPLGEAMEILSRRMEKTSLPDGCRACSRSHICPVCKAAAYLETGNTATPPEYLCQYSEALEKILRKEADFVPGTLSDSGHFCYRHCID